MRTFLPAIVAALALALSASAAMAGPAGLGNTEAGLAATGPFDLGISVISPTPSAVNGYLAALPAAMRSAILNGCESYTPDPDSARSVATVQFCSVAVAPNRPASS